MNPAAAIAGPPAIEMRGVRIGTLRNPEVTVAEDVNWTVGAGEFWVVGAPQHSGKTDFLMTVGGLTTPTAGQYYFLGEEMPIFEEQRLRHRLKLGFVFDGGQLFGQLTAAENIALPLRYHRGLSSSEIEARVQMLTELTELGPWASNPPATMGRSWQQRTGLARALALRPEVLLVDSPLTGLDARHSDWWLNFLDGLHQGHPCMDGKPITLIVTADDLRPWRKPATHVACLMNKQLLTLGDWSSVESSEAEVVKDLLRPVSARD